VLIGRSDPSNYSASRQELTGRGISPLHQRCKLKSSYLPFVLRSGQVSSKDPTHFPIDHFALAPPLFKHMLKLLGHEISHFSAELIRKHYRRFAGFGSPRSHPTQLAQSFPQPFRCRGLDNCNWAVELAAMLKSWQPRRSSPLDPFRLQPAAGARLRRRPSKAAKREGASPISQAIVKKAAL
jgi:hypothetical protein